MAVIRAITSVTNYIVITPTDELRWDSFNVDGDCDVTASPLCTPQLLLNDTEGVFNFSIRFINCLGWADETVDSQ